MSTPLKAISIAAVIILVGAISLMQNSGVVDDQKVTSGQSVFPSTYDNSIGAAAALTPGTYNLVQNESTLTWGAERIVGQAHKGTVAISVGEVVVDEEGEVESGSFAVDMQTIVESNNNERFLEHIRSDDFFDVDNYPKSLLELIEVEALGDGRYLVLGELTIRDKTQPIEFEAQFVESERESLRIKADFEIDRTMWGITFDSGSIFRQLGDRAILDMVAYNLDLVFLKQ